MISEKLQQSAITVINHFGVESQYEKLYEEIQELMNITDEENEIDEMADCFFILLQHYLINPKMQERVDFKAQRTLDRIDTAYYKTAEGENK